MTEFKVGDRVRFRDMSYNEDVKQLIGVEDNIASINGHHSVTLTNTSNPLPGRSAFATGRFEKVQGPSTYLNGLEGSIYTIAPSRGPLLTPFHDWSEDKLVPADEPERPRFMTAWIVNDDRAFVPTGDSFTNLVSAESHALATLMENGTEDQIAVFEIRSVHMARLEVTSEKA